MKYQKLIYIASYFLFVFLYRIKTQQVKLDQLEIYINENNQEKQLFSSNIKNPFFDFIGQNTFSCKVPTVLEEKNDITSRKIFIRNKNDPSKFQNPITIKAITVESSYSFIKPMISGFSGITTLVSGLQISISLDYNCDNEKITKNDFWAIIFVKLDIENSDPLTFSYKKVCSDDMADYNFDYSFIIIAGFCILMVAWQSKRPKILSTIKEFDGYPINTTFAICYVIIASILLLSLIYSQKVMILVFTVVMSILSTLAFALFFNELLTGNLLRYNISKLLIQIPKIGKITLFFLLGILISIPMVVFWAITYNWILTDILTLIITAVCLKLIKFKNLKTATYFFCVEIFFEIVWGVIFMFELDLSYDQFFSSDFTLPLKIECLTFESFFNKKCVWISITNLVYPGLLLSYFNRYDASKNFSVYYFFSLIAFILGNVIWIIVQSKSNFATPSSIYSFSLMLIFTLILAHKRNENFELWNGTFFDVELSDPLINSRNLMENQPKVEGTENKLIGTISEINDTESHKNELENSLMEATLNLEDCGSKFRVK